MLYEIDLIREALLKSDLPTLLKDEPEEWDRFEAEQIVYYLHTKGFRLAGAESPER